MVMPRSVQPFFPLSMIITGDLLRSRTVRLKSKLLWLYSTTFAINHESTAAMPNTARKDLFADYVRTKREHLRVTDKRFSLRQVAQRIGVQPVRDGEF